MNRLQNLLCIGAGILSLSLAGCYSKFSQYNYDGMIGDEKVTCGEQTLNPDGGLTLLVKKRNGNEIAYYDSSKSDLKIEEIGTNRKGGPFVKYTLNDEVGRAVIEEGQKQFDAYLKKILEIRIKQGLNDLLGE